MAALLAFKRWVHDVAEGEIELKDIGRGCRSGGDVFRVLFWNFFVVLQWLGFGRVRGVRICRVSPGSHKLLHTYRLQTIVSSFEQKKGEKLGDFSFNISPHRLVHYFIFYFQVNEWPLVISRGG